MNTVKPGYKTTEFWVAAITTGATFISSIVGALPPDKAAYVTGGIAGLYALARGLAKQQG